MAAFPTSRYPEWKTLYDNVVPLINAGQKDFDYESLSKLAGIDIRGDRGRSQFYRFRRAILEDRQLWFENVSGHGYSIIPAADQSKAAHRRIDGAKRKVKTAKAITANVRWNELTAEERIIHAATAVLLHEVGAAFQTAARKFRTIVKDPLNQIDTTKLLEAMKKK